MKKTTLEKYVKDAVARKVLVTQKEIAEYIDGWRAFDLKGAKGTPNGESQAFIEGYRDNAMVKMLGDLL